MIAMIMLYGYTITYMLLYVKIINTYFDMKLNLGCGRQTKEGFINVDNNPLCSPDVTHDLNAFPYPFTDNQFEEIEMDHVMEHLNDPLAVLQELYRIGNNGAKINIKCPHFSGNWVHPGHKSAISVHLFDFLRTDNEESYGQTNFNIQSVQLSWLRHTNGKRGYWPMRLLNYIINPLANISPSFTERIWCYWVGGFEEIRFVGTVVK